MKRKLVFDPDHLAINENRLHQCDWEEFYSDTDESIPGNIPVARGNFISTHCFIDSNHAGETKTRKSQTGILLF